jgi:hypothetical protein
MAFKSEIYHCGTLIGSAYYQCVRFRDFRCIASKCMITFSTSGRNEVVIVGVELWVFKFYVESTYEIIPDIELRFYACFIHFLKLI